MKDFIAKLGQNKKLMWAVIAGAVAVVAAIVVAVVLLAGGMGNTEPTGDVNYTVCVKTEGGMALSDLQVLVYTDNTLMDLVSVCKTDAKGLAQFTAPYSKNYVLTVSDAPRGYAVAEYYAVTGENTEIVLKAELLKDADLSTLTFAAGDVMFDFTVTDTAGNTYTLSELLTQKKAVVLNFWFVGCDPCKEEFPFLQKAYQDATDVVVLAVSPVSNGEAMSQFAAAQGLELPMVSVSLDWEKAFGVKSYPTTVVIDRYGVIGLTHVGAVDSTKTFTDLFAYFTSDDYTQKKLTSIDEIYAADGSKERPYEFGGVQEFEVTIGAGQVVYCDVYKVSGMELTINDSDVSVVYEGETYEAKDGKVRFVVTSSDTFTPVKLAISNDGSIDKIVKVTFAELPGTMGNPYTLEMGEFTVDIAAGNDQGVYYTYTAAESGTVSVRSMAGEGVKYNITLYNTTTGTFCSLDSDSTEDTLRVEMHAGDKLQFSVSTLPNGANEYPAASLSFNAAFTAGEVSATEPPTEAPTEAPSTNNGGSTNENTGSEEESLIGTYSELYKGQALNIGTGTTDVTLTSGKVNYFVFTPTKSGTYKFTATEPISYWGNNLQYLEQDLASEHLVADNTISLNIKDGHLGSSFVLGVKAGRKVTSATLTLTRTGNAVLSIEDEPWVTYKGSHKPSKNFPASGDNMTIVDITAPTADYTLVKDGDGFYHIGSASGPMVYLDFNDTTRMGALAEILENGIGVRAYIEKSGKTVKEDYTELFEKYVECMDSNGCYPLTDDLIYILKNFGRQQSWWDVSKDGILTGIVGLNKEIAWMCACYY